MRTGLGAWNDHDDRWTPENRAATWDGRQNMAQPEDDGSFFMSLQDFKQYFGRIGVCDPWPLASGDADGDGEPDTASVSGIRLGNGVAATLSTAPAATEVDITAYQKDTRGGAEGKEWHTVTVAVKCMATGGQWMDVMLFPMRCYSRPIPLQPGENQIEVRATLGAPGEATEQDCVWLSAAAAGGCALSGPPPPCADTPAPSLALEAAAAATPAVHAAAPPAAAPPAAAPTPPAAHSVAPPPPPGAPTGTGANSSTTAAAVGTVAVGALAACLLFA